ncbi:hypothetical protein E2I00_009163 [Balaenoptera physalus]|uniref:Spondin-like TSP1 domain-containing protein n=1 Tax=Balaenoptera physalus TaxID=9770 RepID=A0A6A1QDV7_BALPH|nr:hypothetical protein E2I00_009163 [Balaenoptera physalus]
MGDECGPGGIQTRAVWCAHVEGWTTLHTNCKQAERPSNQQNCFKVCDWHKELYDWRLGPWNHCQPVISKSLEKPLECVKGEEGIQVREIMCIQKEKDIPAEDIICEYFEPKPLLEQACLIPCQQDCIVSEFSAWSECSKTCGSGLQHRTRHVVAPPQFGGSGCPNLTEFQVCQSGACEAEESMYSLQVGPWSTCSIPHSRQVRQTRRRGKNKERGRGRGKGVKDPEARELIKKKRNRNRQNRQENKYWDIQIGYQTREVMCTNKTGKAADLSLYINSTLAFQIVMNHAQEYSTAMGMWSVGCIFGELLTQKPLFPGKSEIDQINKVFKDLGTPNQGFDLTKKFLTYFAGRRVNAKNGLKHEYFRETPLPIDPSMLPTGEIEKRDNFMKSDSSVSDTSFCRQEKLPLTFQACVITKECQVSEWSEWSPCSKTCHDMASPKGTRVRTRLIRQFPIGSEKACPELEEKEPCVSQGDGVAPCAMYGWRTTEWTECRVDPLLSQQDKRRGNQTALCGGGVQTREVYCVQANEDLLSHLNTHKDKEVLNCGDQEWDHPAGDGAEEHSSFKLRKRRITNEPTGGSGGAGNCPHLLEAIPCEEPSCYDWKAVRLGDCEPDNGRECGPGTQIQEVVCINSDGSKVVMQDSIRYSVLRGIGLAVTGGRAKMGSLTCFASAANRLLSLIFTSYTGWGMEGSAEDASRQLPRRVLVCTARRARRVLPSHRAGSAKTARPPDRPTDPKKRIKSSADSYHAKSLPEGEELGEEVDRQLCRDAIFPIPVACDAPCPKDCVLSMWSAWSSCSHTCSGKTTEGKQIRARSILAYAGEEGGAQCPNSSALQEVRSCNEHPCTVYHWQTGPWGQCIEDTSVSSFNTTTTWNGETSCSVGMQTRKVICVRVNVGQLTKYLAKEISKPYKTEFWRLSMITIGSFLVAAEKHVSILQVTYAQYCQFDIFIEGDSGIRKQTRHRVIIQLPANGGKDCTDPLYEEKACEAPQLCQSYRWKTHKWRRCQLVPWSVQQDSPGAQEGCGPGRQARAITCRKQDGGQTGIHECLRYAGPVPALTQACQIPCQDDCQFTSWSKFSSCNGDCGAVRTRKRTIVGYIEEACIIPCPSDCKLSEWSNWSRCSKSCGSGVKVRSKWLREKPYNGGRPCPKLDHVNQVYEVVPCHSDCSQYIWVTEPWSICKVTFVNMRDNCGEGVQTRKVRCMQNTADGPSDHVEDYLCDPEEMPLGSRECKLPCPEDCPCNQSSFRQRSADPIRQPADEGRACPDAVEKEPCNLNKNCFHYDYNVTDWSTCQLSEKAVCGNGMKTRMLDCVRSDGKSVNLKYCEEFCVDKQKYKI